MAENYGSLEGVLDANETLEGEIDSHDEMSGEIQFSGGANGVRDVKVNGESVVDENKVANIDLTPYAEIENVYDKQTIDTALEGKADTDDIPTDLSDLQDDSDHRLVTDSEKTEWSGKSNVSANPATTTETLTSIEINGTGYAIPSGGSGDVADVKVNGTSVVDPVTKEANIDLTGYAETSDIPTDLADLSDDSTHRLVTDTEKAGWDAKADTSDIPEVNNNTITIQKNGQNVDSFNLNQDSNKAINIAVPTKTSDLQNDSSFITNTVNNLANYYLKSDTYTQTEVNNLISAAVNGRFEKVTVLPASGEPNVIYLVPKTTALTNNVYDEYIWQDNAWELLGSTEIDLSNYVTTTDLSTALADYVTSSTFNTTIANYYTKTEVGNLLDEKVDKVSGKGLSTYDYDATAKGIVDNVTTNLAGKVDKVNGKGLSTEDYTTTEKNKLAGISTGANKVESSTTNGNIKIDGVETQVYDGSGKVDKVNGKGLSTNDFTNEDKALIGQTLGNNTVLTTDKTPFITRQTLNPTGFSGYVREKLVGASYAWNQLVQNGNFASTDGWSTYQATISVSNNVCTMVRAVASGSNSMYRVVTKQPNHKYLWSFKAKNNVGSNSIMAQWFKSGTSGSTISLLANTGISNNYTTYSGIIATDNSDANGALIIFLTTATVNNSIDIKEIQITDLTLAFGSTIADYFYGLSNNGGITKLRDMGCPIDKYTPYGYGLYSVKTSGKRVLSANLITGLYNGLRYSNGNTYSNATRVSTDGFISLTPNKYKIISKSNISGKTLRIAYHFWSNTTEGSNSQTYDSGWINLSETTELEITSNVIMDGTFSFTDNSSITPSDIEVKLVASVTTYHLGNDELRGKFDLVNSEIVASGDVKESNGNAKRYWGYVADISTLSWNYNSGTKRWFALLDGAENYGARNTNILSSHYTVDTNAVAGDNGKCFFADKGIYVYSTDSVNVPIGSCIYELATPTTEQSTPFADPMSLVGATIEEYIDARDIPCPVGAERQYMGQSEDVVEIPSVPHSDGVWVYKCYVSGGKAQYVWELERTL